MKILHDHAYKPADDNRTQNPKSIQIIDLKVYEKCFE